MGMGIITGTIIMAITTITTMATAMFTASRVITSRTIRSPSTNIITTRRRLTPLLRK